MPYAVTPALIPDITPVYDVYFEAFKGHKVMEFLYPSGVDRQAHKHGTTLWWHHDKNGHTVKCVDSDTGAIVGMATWEIYWRPGKENMWYKPKGAEWMKGKDRQKAETVLVPLWQMRDKFFGGRKHLYCQTLAVHPNYRRKGIGKLLLQWGLDIGEQLSLPVYLEATDLSEPLYESMGCERVTHEKVVIKASVLGEKEDFNVPLFVKMPSKAKGLSFKAWAAKKYPESY